MFLTCFGATIWPTSGSWQQNFFKTRSNKKTYNYCFTNIIFTHI